MTACSSGPGGVATSPPARSAKLLNAPVSGFGGYFARGSVDDLGAHWRVPMITGVSDDAHASTWIGVQDHEGDFLQIGTTEDESSGRTAYSAFWSDPVVGFHPQFILTVSPGDEIAAELVEDPGGWSGTLDDMTTGRRARVPSSIRYAPRSAMQLSDWVQEDPATDGGIVDLPYPTMTQVTFTDLRVDRGTPTLPFDDGTAMASPNGVVLVPGVERNDGFTMESGTPTQGRYLRDVAGFDSAIKGFVDPHVVGAGTTAAHGKALIAGIATFDARLSAQPWPAGSQSDIRKLIAHDQVLADDLRVWIAGSPSQRRLARFTADARLDRQLSNAVRSDLGLPSI